MSANAFVIHNDMSDLCRVCLQLPEKSQYLDLTTIYDEEENLTYGECFTICTQIDLSAGEGLPHYLCKQCGLELQMSYDFHKKIEDSKRIIEQYQMQMKVQNANISESTVISRQPKNLDINENDKANTLDLIEEKYVISGGQFTAQLKGTEEDCLMQEENENTFLNEETDETENLNNMCNIDIKVEHQVTSHESNSSVMGDMNENDEDHLGLDDYQNVEALEEATTVDVPAFMSKEEYIESENTTEDEIIINTTITPCIPVGMRLPLPAGPPFICEFCGHSSKSKSLLASHRHRKHRHKETPYQCVKCNRCFKSQEVCDKHTRRLSCQRYPVFTCEYCAKKIKGSANYEIHLRFHKKIYPFLCKQCGKGFMMTAHLKSHVQTKHESKRYVCEEPDCGKFFQSMQSLKSHMYVHLESMPYCCEYCGKMLPNRGRLRWHMRTVHRLNVGWEHLDRMLVAEEINIKADVKSVDLSDL